MNKAEFIEAVADNAELTKADAGRAVDAMDRVRGLMARYRTVTR